MAKRGRKPKGGGAAVLDRKASTRAQSKAEEAQRLADGKPVPVGHVYVEAGRWVEMINERWYGASDNGINEPLTPERSRFGVALEAFSYDPAEGAANKDAKTFTLLQFFQDASRPALDYTDDSIRDWLMYLRKYLNLQRVKRIEDVLVPAKRRFETLYKDIDRDLAQLGAGSL